MHAEVLYINKITVGKGSAVNILTAKSLKRDCAIAILLPIASLWIIKEMADTFISLEWIFITTAMFGLLIGLFLFRFFRKIELSTALKQYKWLVNNITAPVLLVDNHGKIIYKNTGFRNISDLNQAKSLEEIIDQYGSVEQELVPEQDFEHTIVIDNSKYNLVRSSLTTDSGKQFGYIVELILQAEVITNEIVREVPVVETVVEEVLITEDKSTTDELLLDSINGSHNPTLILDNSDKIICINNALKQILNIDDLVDEGEENYQHGLITHLFGQNGDTIEERINEVKATGNIVRQELTWQKRSFDVLLRPLFSHQIRIGISVELITPSIRQYHNILDQKRKAEQESKQLVRETSNLAQAIVELELYKPGNLHGLNNLQAKQFSSPLVMNIAKNVGKICENSNILAKEVAHLKKVIKCQADNEHEKFNTPLHQVGILAGSLSRNVKTLSQEFRSYVSAIVEMNSSSHTMHVDNASCNDLKIVVDSIEDGNIQDLHVIENITIIMQEVHHLQVVIEHLTSHIRSNRSANSESDNLVIKSLLQVSKVLEKNKQRLTKTISRFEQNRSNDARLVAMLQNFYNRLRKQILNQVSGSHSYDLVNSKGQDLMLRIKQLNDIGNQIIDKSSIDTTSDPLFSSSQEIADKFDTVVFDNETTTGSQKAS